MPEIMLTSMGSALLTKSQADDPGALSAHAADRALNADTRGLRIRGGRCGFPGSSGGWRAAGAGGMQEAFDAAGAHAVGRGAGGGGGAVAVSGDQLGDLALVEALAQAPWTFRVGLAAHTGLVSILVWQSSRSTAYVECE